MLNLVIKSLTSHHSAKHNPQQYRRRISAVYAALLKNRGCWATAPTAPAAPRVLGDIVGGCRRMHAADNSLGGKKNPPYYYVRDHF